MRRLFVGLSVWMAAAFLPAIPAAGEGHVIVVKVSGSINPAVSDYLRKAIERGGQEGAAALLLELDTPGGLVTSTKDIITAMLNAPLPVIVYVAPQGAWAGSAGAFITLAGHVAAMAPGTSIGAASPVTLGGGGAPPGGDEEKGRDVAAAKAMNLMAAYIESIAKQRQRNVEWAVKAVREAVAVAQDEALELGVIDVVASSRADLFAQIQGREIALASGRTVVLELTDAPQREIAMSPLNRVIDILSTPDIAMLLILAGMLGLYVEFTQPGVIFPGVAGGICLVLGFISLQILPFSWLGLLLLSGGIALMVAELFVASYGLLFLTGTAGILLGGSLLFELPEVGDLSVSFWSVLVPAVAALALFGGIVVLVAGRGMLRPQVAGTGEMMGKVGRATTALAPEGTVFLRGEYWSVRADEPIAEGERIEVTAVEGLRLRVRRARPEA